MSTLHSKIDFISLEGELQDALMADELYKLQNDAKIRAIEQRVPTYEHFRQIVNGAHLKPLERDDTKFKIRIPWNSNILGSRLRSETVSNKLEKTNKENPNRIVTKLAPTKCEDFMRNWKKCIDHKDKFIYLWNMRHGLQETIFSIEIPSSLFSELIAVCLQNITVNNINSIIEILDILSKCNRFRLTLSFMSEHDKLLCSQLFRELHIKTNGEKNEFLKNTIKLLSIKYEVITS